MQPLLNLFLISFASVRSIPFLSFIEPIFAWNVPLVSLIFLQRSLVFPILLFPSISLHWSMRKVFLSLLAILWNSAFSWIYISLYSLPFASLLFSAICKASSENHFASFSWGWSRPLPPVQCHVPPSRVLQALCLSDLISWICLSLLLHNHKRFGLGQTWKVWKRSFFIPIPKKVNAKECSNYRTIALISLASKVMLKILQAKLQQYVNCELPDVLARFRKGRGTRDQITNICWIIEKPREFQKNVYFCYIDYAKAFDCVDHNKPENS